MISDNTIKAIQEAVDTTTLNIDGVVYATRAVHDVRKADPELKALEVHGLAGLVEFVAAHNIVGPTREGDTENPRDVKAMVHVKDHAKIDLVSEPYGWFKQRESYAQARCVKSDFEFGTYYEPDEFVIALLTQFVQTETTAALLSIVGNMEQQAETRVVDDGVHQEVNVRRGVSLKDRAMLPSPIMLQPYRTFREIEQPASPFALRVDQGPTVALFEADGSTWQIDAIRRIKEWLRTNLPEGFPIIG